MEEYYLGLIAMLLSIIACEITKVEEFKYLAITLMIIMICDAGIEVYPFAEKYL